MAADNDPRMAALAIANERRVAKARLKESWAPPRAGQDVLREIAGMLEDPKETHRLDAFKVGELLLAVPGVGRTKARQLAIAAERLELMNKVGPLTARQRGVLAEVLRDRAVEVEARHATAA